MRDRRSRIGFKIFAHVLENSQKFEISKNPKNFLANFFLARKFFFGPQIFFLARMKIPTRKFFFGKLANLENLANFNLRDLMRRQISEEIGCSRPISRIPSILNNI